VDIKAMELNAAISGSILADPEACFVMMMMALPFGSIAQDMKLDRPAAAIHPPACAPLSRVDARTSILAGANPTDQIR
jgi:hypothetical protein